jgi:serine protease
MVVSSICVLLAAAAPSIAVQSPSVATQAFHDGERLLQIHRTTPSHATLRDVASGRHTAVVIEATALLRTEDHHQPPFAALGVVPVRLLDDQLGWWLVSDLLPNHDGVDIATRLSGRSDVRVYPNLRFAHRLAEDRYVPNDPDYPGQWFFPEIDLEDTWQTSTGAATVRIAIIDNGCELDHPDLIDKFAGGNHLDVIDDDNDPSPGTGPGNEHGTACAGLAAASTNNNLDIAGACPNCTLSCIRLLADDGEGVPLDADVRAFVHARDSGVAVVSNSWGFVDAFPVPGPLAEAIIDVQQNGNDGQGAVVVFAAGNDNRIVGDDELLGVAGIIGVGAVTNLGELTQYTNRGLSVDVVAPTGAVTTDLSGAAGADPGAVMSTFGGTSSACPIVAGVAGLLLSQGAAAADVGPLLIATARQSFLAEAVAISNHDDGYGYGRIQPVAAMATLVDDEPIADMPPPPSCTCHNRPLAPPWCVLAALSVIVGRVRRRP